MTNRKILYGYQIVHGDLVIQEEERLTVQNVFTTYLAGLSYQALADRMNADNIPFSQESPLWNKHKIKRMLENPRYAGKMDTHPSLTKIPSSKCRIRLRKRLVGSFRAGWNRMAYGQSCEADAVRLACFEPEGQSGIPETSI